MTPEALRAEIEATARAAGGPWCGCDECHRERLACYRLALKHAIERQDKKIAAATAVTLLHLDAIAAAAERLP